MRARRSSSTVLKRRTHGRFSFSVRMNRSAQPLPSGSRTNAGELSRPRKRISAWKWWLTYRLPPPTAWETDASGAGCREPGALRGSGNRPLDHAIVSEEACHPRVGEDRPGSLEQLEAGLDVALVDPEAVVGHDHVPADVGQEAQAVGDLEHVVDHLPPVRDLYPGHPRP